MTSIADPGERTRRRSSLVEGDFAFTTEDFRQIAQTLHAHAGIVLNDTKAALVYSRLAKRLRMLGLQSFRDYCRLIEGVDGVDERQAMVAALTTNVTRFYREPHHFEDLARTLRPDLVERARQGGRVRLWSSACSTGQEAYCMALTVLETLPEAADLDVRILASDIDPNVLATAKEGVYPQEALDAVPTAQRRWFEAVEAGQARVREQVRRLVSFRELNLLEPWPMRGRFDVVFCRNVAIYFDEPTQVDIWSRIAGVLSPGGRLYIGHSERIHGEAARVLRPVGLTIYERSEAP